MMPAGRGLGKAATGAHPFPMARAKWNPINVPATLYRAVRGNVGSLRYYVGDMRVRRDDVGQPGDTVLLIQGFMQTRQVMETLEDRLRADGFRVLSFHMGGLLDNFNTRSVPSLAKMIDAKIEKLRERQPFVRLHVVAHSMGGLVGRWLVQRAGGDKYVRTVVTLGTPHHGTPTAAIGMGVGLAFVSRGLWQMLPGSPMVRDLNRESFPKGVRLVSVYSRGDLVCPWQFSVLTARDGEDVRNVMVRGLGHMSLVEDPYVYGLILRELTEHPYDTSGGPVAPPDEERTRR
jgi:pimeloyl-ACP methyl ester carboxylesterase